MTEFTGRCSFYNLSKTDVVLPSSEAAAQFIVETTFWRDWWTFAAKSMISRSSNEVRLLKQLFVAGARCQLLVAKMASSVWANLVLKRRDAVLTKVKDSISFGSFMDLCSSPLSCSTELSPREPVEKAIEKSPRILNNEAIWKTLSADKPTSSSSSQC